MPKSAMVPENCTETWRVGNGTFCTGRAIVISWRAGEPAGALR
jgi:hypothetical protein